MEGLVTYYAHIDKIEVDSDGKLIFEFHCLEKGFADNVLAYEREQFHAAIVESSERVIVLEENKERIEHYFFSNEYGENESQWMILSTNQSSIGLQASLFVENEGQSISIFINGFEIISPDSPIGRLLFDMVSLNGFIDTENKEEILSALVSSSSKSNPEFIAAYKVGQGNCNAVCNSDSMPLIYFDIGGGCYANSRTYSKPLKFCFSFNPSIILSHWDTDHYQSAKVIPDLKNKQWIVPRQVIGPVHLKFFLSLPSSRIIWPKYINEIKFNWGTLVLCNGPKGKKNHTGIAFIAELNPRRNKIRDVLLPADAAYTYIPGIHGKLFDGIIATHHGANFDNSNAPIPLPKGSGAIVYSYGYKNSYRHPKVDAVKAHKAAGWNSSIRHTTKGHIALIDKNKFPMLPCNSRVCNLQTKQNFN